MPKAHHVPDSTQKNRLIGLSPLMCTRPWGRLRSHPHFIGEVIEVDTAGIELSWEEPSPESHGSGLGPRFCRF